MTNTAYITSYDGPGAAANDDYDRPAHPWAVCDADGPLYLSSTVEQAVETCRRGALDGTGTPFTHATLPTGATVEL